MKLKTFFLAVLVTFILFGQFAIADELNETTITVLSTTDLHGNIYPIDYFTNTPKNLGLAKISTLVEKIRKENPNTILIDDGDTIQGTPLAYYHIKYMPQTPDPMIMVMNYMGYTSMTVGNHEFNFGLKNLKKVESEAKFPLLSANIYEGNNNEFTPYIIKNINGIKVAIIGLTTPGVPYWEDPWNFEGLTFSDPTKEAVKWLGIVTEKEDPDIIILAGHFGLDRDNKTLQIRQDSVPNENPAFQISEQSIGYDAIFMGHTHKKITSFTNKNTLMAQANSYGQNLARIDFKLKKNNYGKWEIVSKTADSIDITDDIKPDEKVLEIAKSYHDKTQNYLDTPIAENPAELKANDAYFKPNIIVDIVNKTQQKFGNAEISMASMFNPDLVIKKGKVTIREVCAIYLYNNSLYVVKITGKILKEVLEYSAKYFNQYKGQTSLKELINPDIRGYNYDIALGINYEIDINEPVGKRIKNLTYKGLPISDTQEFTLAINNYRYNGGGGYNMYKDCPVIKNSSEEIMNMVIDYVKELKVLPTEPINNWKIIPEEVQNLK